MSILNLAAPQRGQLPPRILVHGTEKIGKSTFFGGGRYGNEDHPGVDKAIFIQTEDGLAGTHATALPLISTFDELMGQLKAIGIDEHDYSALIIDSIDWLEKILVEHVIATCPEAKNGKENLTIELAHGGYGKGYGYVNKLFLDILKALSWIRASRKMMIGLICHSQVVEFNDPIAEPYDRYELKLHAPKRGRGNRDAVMEWADVIGFAQKEIIVTQKQTARGDTVSRGMELPTSAPVLHLTSEPGFVAGNRYGIQGKIDLSWDAFSQAYSDATNQPIYQRN